MAILSRGNILILQVYIKKCIDSVLNQTYFDFELLIIDDCSTDISIESQHRKQAEFLSFMPHLFQRWIFI